MALDVLIVDDEKDIRDLIAGILEDEGYTTRTAANSDEALREVEARRPSLLILDIWLQGSKKDGLEILRMVKGSLKDLPVIMISGHGNIETAVRAIKYGAYDFIEKPFQTDKLLHLVARATEADSLRRENESLKKLTGGPARLSGKSGTIQTLRADIEKVAPTNSRVMIFGPAGAGKETVARLIHEKSHRANGMFVIANSAAMAPEQMEPELFGVEQNGKMVKAGLLEQAHGGTLFLDEVGDMPEPTQAKILRVLTDQSFVRVGGTKKVQVDVRVLSSTTRDLENPGERAKPFREDLFHRLNVVPIRVPSLADRREDIPVLAEEFMEGLAEATGRQPRDFAPDAIAALQSAEWPGNVRQLRNVIERVLILSHDTADDIITVDMLPNSLGPSAGGHGNLSGEGSENIMAVPLKEARESFERDYLRVQITRFSGNISRTASFVGMERSALHRKLRALGVTSKNDNGNGKDD